MKSFRCCLVLLFAALLIKSIDGQKNHKKSRKTHSEEYDETKETHDKEVLSDIPKKLRSQFLSLVSGLNSPVTDAVKTDEIASLPAKTFDNVQDSVTQFGNKQLNQISQIFNNPKTLRSSFGTDEIKTMSNGMQSTLEDMFKKFAASGDENSNVNIQSVTQSSDEENPWKNVNIQAVQNQKSAKRRGFLDDPNEIAEPFQNFFQHDEDVGLPTFIYPIGSEIPVVEPQPAKIVRRRQKTMRRNNLGSYEGDLIVNSDGSLPVNIPLRYVFQVINSAENLVKSTLKENGFFRNLIFAEGLFKKDNDGAAMNSAVVNVNIFMSKPTQSIESSDEYTKHQRKIPGNVEIFVNNDYDVRRSEVH